MVMIVEKVNFCGTSHLGKLRCSTVVCLIPRSWRWIRMNQNSSVAVIVASARESNHRRRLVMLPVVS